MVGNEGYVGPNFFELPAGLTLSSCTFFHFLYGSFIHNVEHLVKLFFHYFLFQINSLQYQ